MIDLPKKIYIEHKNISSLVTSAYVGISDKSRKIVKGYIGIDGISHQIYPPLYVWNRYSINTQYKYREVETLTQSSVENGLGYHQSYSSATYSFDESTGLFTLTNISYIRGNQVSFPCYATDAIVYTSNHKLMQIKCTSDPVDHIAKITSGISIYKLSSEKVKVSESQGEYVDQITSENSNEYPENGILGEYWYVLQK